MFKITLRQFLVALAFLATSAVATAQSWPPAGMQGSGDSISPWQITTAAQLAQLATYVNKPNATRGKYFKLMNDIDLSGYPNWNPIGDRNICVGDACAEFEGYFDGNGKVVENLTINKPAASPIGLFGGVVGNATIVNLGVVNCNVIGQNCVGGLVGEIYSGTTIVISGCYTTGSVSGNYVGGLVGSGSTYSTSISNCYSTCKVSGRAFYTGGLVGHIFSGTISNCYATGSVSGKERVGGLVGDCYGTGVIFNCIAANDTIISTTNTNDINRIAGFYNMNTIRNNYALNSMVVQNSNGNISITPDLNTKAGMDIPMSDLQSLSFYATASNWHNNQAWDLDTWKICDGQDLPFLRWQGIDCYYDITATAGVNGTINPSGTVTVEEGNSQTFIFSPNNGYEIDEVLIDGTNNPAAVLSGDYTFENITANHSIAVSFRTETGVVETLHETSLQIYPNPAFTQLYVKHFLRETVNYTIYNVVGQTILQGKLQDDSAINIESLASGMYYLKVAGKTVKFVKN